MVESVTMRQMPLYQCHKRVWALKIAQVFEDNDGGHFLEFEEEGYEPREVSEGYVIKHNPEPGGYFVVYKDGYESFSPAKAFEEGYSVV